MTRIISLTSAAAAVCVLFLAGCGQESQTANTADVSGSADATAAGSDTAADTGSRSIAATTASSSKVADAAAAQPGVSAASGSPVSSADLPTPDLAPGEAAPPITISSWVQGTPVEKFDAGQVYVVEFWATWCGPCLQAMPHMSALQEEYGDKVRFVGISNENEATVGAFMERKSHLDKPWSEVLSYTIALDDQDATNAAYMAAAKRGGIPCAFVVGKTGNIEWIGHPLGIDEPLQQIVAGTWDTAASRYVFAIESAPEMINDAAQAGKFAEALKMCDQVEAIVPENAAEVIFMRLQLLAHAGRADELRAAASKTLEKYPENAGLINLVAYVMSTLESPAKSDLELSVRAAQRAVELTNGEDPNVLDTLATALYSSGDLAGAIATQKKSVAAAPGFAPFQERLEAYEAEASGEGDSPAPAP